MALPSTTIRTEGLASLRRDLRRIDSGMAKGLTAELRELGKEVQGRVRGTSTAPHRTGKLRRSVKVSVRSRDVTLYSNLPQAGVWEWGGTIQPRGTPIQIPRTQFVRAEVWDAADDTEARLARIFDALARGGSF